MKGIPRHKLLPSRSREMACGNGLVLLNGKIRQREEQAANAVEQKEDPNSAQVRAFGSPQLFGHEPHRSSQAHTCPGMHAREGGRGGTLRGISKKHHPMRWQLKYRVRHGKMKHDRKLTTLDIFYLISGYLCHCDMAIFKKPLWKSILLLILSYIISSWIKSHTVKIVWSEVAYCIIL